LAAARRRLDDFYNQWNKQQQGTEKSVNDDFDKQLAHWKDLLNSKHFTGTVQRCLAEDRTGNAKKV